MVECSGSTHIVTRLSKIHILCCMVYCVIMIPQSTSVLAIWVVIVLVLTNFSNVVGVTVENSATERSVKMDRVGSVTSLIDWRIVNTLVKKSCVTSLLNRTTASRPCVIWKVGPDNVSLAFPMRLIDIYQVQDHRSQPF
jgi:hypothetical protein